tara:strand:+ start:167 stop:397 length:231 start_codon:yes stop_codon:yes gene_type:complete
MPIYEYECSECTLRFDKRKNFKDVALAVSCPKCGGLGDRRLSVFASVSMATSRENITSTAGDTRTGGCCGGGCCSN